MLKGIILRSKMMTNIPKQMKCRTLEYNRYTKEKDCNRISNYNMMSIMKKPQIRKIRQKEKA